MKITDVIITPIALSDPPLLNATGRHAPYVLRLVVEIVSDNGITGVSEIPGGETNEAALRAAAHLLDGHSPFDFHRLNRLLKEHYRATPDADGWRRRKAHVRSAFEVACYDMVGKAQGLRVADLLGGAVRTEIPFSAYLFFKDAGAGGALGDGKQAGLTGWDAVRQEQAHTAEDILVQARSMVDTFGFGALKLKGGAFHPSIETGAILALREHFGPEMLLRFDPNACWSMETALKYGGEMSSVLEYLEDPVRGQEAMAALRSQLNVPFATNMCTTGLSDLPSSFRLGSEDIILSDHHMWGGFQPCMVLAEFCRVFGRGLSMHSNNHAGISLMAMAHMAAATPNLTYALDTHYPWQVEDVLKGDRIVIENGGVTLPPAPGLGVEIDPAKLRQLHQNYVSSGLKERNDLSEMQKNRPGYVANPVKF